MQGLRETLRYYMQKVDVINKAVRQILLYNKILETVRAELANRCCVTVT